jgi:tRNA A37 threonylcarbamoyladenosine dehydratase
MGAGSKLDPTRVQVSTLEDSQICRLARIMRKELRRRDVDLTRIDAVWSDEPAVVLDNDVADAFRCICPGGDNGQHGCDSRNVIQGTVSFLPSMFGLMAAGAVVNDLIGRPLVERAAAAAK